MKITSVAALALVTSSALAQSTIERTVVNSAGRSERVDFGPLNSGGHPGLFLREDLHIETVPSLTGVTLRSFQISGQATASGQLSAHNPTSQMQYVAGEYSNGSDCYGHSGPWGPIYGSYDYVDFGPYAIAPGDTRVINLWGYPGSWHETYDASHWGWPLILVNRSLTADVGIMSISFPTNQEVSGWVEADLFVTAASIVELEEVTMLPTCPSPPNSLGSAARLSAFGSLTAGENWLTIRANGVPSGEFGVMFVGTQPGLFVLPTYNICLGGSLLRVGGVQLATAATLDFEFDLLGWSPGDTAYCQVIHRDPVLGVCASEAGVVVVE